MGDFGVQRRTLLEHWKKGWECIVYMVVLYSYIWLYCTCIYGCMFCMLLFNFS